MTLDKCRTPFFSDQCHPRESAATMFEFGVLPARVEHEHLASRGHFIELREQVTLHVVDKNPPVRLRKDVRHEGPQVRCVHPSLARADGSGCKQVSISDPCRQVEVGPLNSRFGIDEDLSRCSRVAWRDNNQCEATCVVSHLWSACRGRHRCDGERNSLKRLTCRDRPCLEASVR